MAEFSRNGRSGLALGAAALIAVVFGVATIASGGSVLFGPDLARETAGDVVPFVLWFNTLAGFAYVAAGIAIWVRHRWAAPLSMAIAAATALVAAGFAVWVIRGGAYEIRTAAALALRFGVWVAIAATVLGARSRP